MHWTHKFRNSSSSSRCSSAGTTGQAGTPHIVQNSSRLIGAEVHNLCTFFSVCDQFSSFHLLWHSNEHRLPCPFSFSRSVRHVQYCWMKYSNMISRSLFGFSGILPTLHTCTLIYFLCFIVLRHFLQGRNDAAFRNSGRLESSTYFYRLESQQYRKELRFIVRELTLFIPNFSHRLTSKNWPLLIISDECEIQLWSLVRNMIEYVRALLTW